MLWESPVWSFLFALAIYTLISIYHAPLGSSSNNAYYNYLADAFLHGQLPLRLIPPDVHDLVFFGGSYYLYWPPFPALLLMPWVALFGVGFSDILFTLVIGALNVAGVAMLLRAAAERGLLALDQYRRSLLVFFFALGTVYLTLAPFGRVWFTGQLVGFMCVVVAYWAVIALRGRRAFLLAGIAIACAFATRNDLILAGIWPAWFLLREHWELRWKKLIGLALVSAIPILLVGGLLGVYNFVRFGNPLDVGLAYHEMAALFQPDYNSYGVFNLHYLPINFYYQYIFYPFPFRAETTMGGSLFLLSPLFLAALWALWVDRRKLSTWALLATILAVNIPIVLLMGTGWAQFGPRYTLDFTIPLLFLTAMGMQRWRPRIIALLIAISCLQYLAGVIFLSYQF